MIGAKNRNRLGPHRRGAQADPGSRGRFGPLLAHVHKSLMNYLLNGKVMRTVHSGKISGVGKRRGHPHIGQRLAQRIFFTECEFGNKYVDALIFNLTDPLVQLLGGERTLELTEIIFCRQ